MTILVTGANGQLGNEMRVLSAGSAHKFIFTDVCEASPDAVQMLRKLAGHDADSSTVILDITDAGAVRSAITRYEVDVLVNCAAYTNVDAAEDNEVLAELLNAKAVANLATAAKERNALLIHVSTDYVFGGERYNTPCREDLPCIPTGVYGRSKLHGEQAVVASGCSYIILRSAWLYSEFGKNFVKTIMSLAAARPQLNVVFDQVGTPTYARDLAGAILQIIETRGTNPGNGIFNYSNEGVCSWYDFAVAIASLSGIQGCDILPCLSADFPSKVVRPSYSVLDKSKIKDSFSLIVPYWLDSLRNCLDRMR